VSLFVDYYAILDVSPEASLAQIREAFRRLARQYHPDVDKSEGAQARFIVLRNAFDVLSNPAQRRAFDAEYAERRRLSGNHLLSRVKTKLEQAIRVSTQRGRGSTWIIANLAENIPVRLAIDTLPFFLTARDVYALLHNGYVRGLAREEIVRQSGAAKIVRYSCHRCHSHWETTGSGRGVPLTCPVCQAEDWREYLLMYCYFCHALFEERQLRYGESYAYPYELFPLCPGCLASHWCPAEEARVQRPI